MQAQERTCSLGPMRNNTSSFLSKASSFVNPYIDERFRDKKKAKTRGCSIGIEGIKERNENTLSKDRLESPKQMPPNSFNIALNNYKERDHHPIDTF